MDDGIALLTDLYEFAMVDAYLDEDLHDEAVFSLFVRRLPALGEDDEGGDAPHAQGRGRLRVRIRVQLEHEEPPRLGLTQRLQHGSGGPARSTPGRPEIQQHRHRRGGHGPRERLSVHLLRLARDIQSAVTAATGGSPRWSRLGYTIESTAGWTAKHGTPPRLL
jgi:hypothetical protein